MNPADPNNANNHYPWGFKVPVEHTWEDLTAAAEVLDPINHKDGYFLLVVKDKARYKRLPLEVRRAGDALIQVAKGERFTQSYVKYFDDCKPLGEEEIKFYLSYLKDNKIEPDSTVNGVLYDIKRKRKKFKIGSSIEPILENLIRWAQIARQLDLCYEYALYLTNCNFIDHKSSDKDCLHTLMKDPIFKKRFCKLSEYDFSSGLYNYIGYLRIHASERNPKLNFKVTIGKEYSFLKGLYDKLIEKIPDQYTTPVHFVAYKKIVEGYDIQRTEMELIKIQVFFGGQNPPPLEFLDSLPDGFSTTSKKRQRPDNEAGSPSGFMKRESHLLRMNAPWIP